MTKYRYLPAGVKFVINCIVVLLFLAALFCAGMAIYAKIYDLSYGAAWANLAQAIQSAK